MSEKWKEKNQEEAKSQKTKESFKKDERKYRPEGQSTIFEKYCEQPIEHEDESKTFIH